MTRTRTVTIDGVDRSADVLEELTITSGRTNILDPCGPFTLTAAIRTPALASLSIGAEIVVSVGSGTYKERFRGEIVSLSSDRYVTQLVAIDGMYRQLARKQVTAYTIPASMAYSGGSRTPQISYVLIDWLYTAGLITAANRDTGLATSLTTGFSTVTFTTPEGVTYSIDKDTTLLRAGAVIPAGTAVDGLTAFCANTRSGQYRTTQTVCRINFSRQIAGSAADFRPQTSETGFDWFAEQTTDYLCNRSTVTYGVSSTLQVSEESSIASYGPADLDVTTQLDDVNNAIGRAIGLVWARRSPKWVTNPIRISFEEMTNLRFDNAVVWLKCGDVWNLQYLQTDIPQLPRWVFVEGATETITRTAHYADVTAFDAIYTNTPETWAQVDGSLTWANVYPASLNWYDAIGAVL